MADVHYGPQHSGTGDIKEEGGQAYGPGASVIHEAGTVVQQPTGPVHTGEGDQNNNPPDPKAPNPTAA